MILTVIDGNGAPQQVAVAAPGTATDSSGAVAANLPPPGPFTYQQLLPAVAAGSAPRGGWFVVNNSTDVMKVTEDGTDPSSSATAVTVYPGQMFPPPGVAYPITQGAVNLSGTAGDKFSSKVW